MTATGYLLTAVWQLALARRQYGRYSTAELVRWLDTGNLVPGRRGSSKTVDLQMMRWALSGAGNRVPWRADCLVQTLAARRWLSRAGIASTAHFGAQRTNAGSLVAHAWLAVDGVPVTGGENSELAVFSTSLNTPA